MRVISFILLALSALYLPFWFFALCAIVYALVIQSPYEFVLLGLCVDALYGNPAQGIWYMYTATTSFLFVGIALIRPHFTFSL